MKSSRKSPTIPQANFERGPFYRDLCNKLVAQEKLGAVPLLNVHIPGTGGRKFDGFPTYTALSTLDRTSAAVLYFEGVGGREELGDNPDAYVPPVRSNPNSIEAGSKKPVRRLRGLFAASTSNAEEFAANTPKLAGVVGAITGAGDITNNERVINLLHALEQDNALPYCMFLSGHSRGAVNCISMANKIYCEFGDRIRLHICITDPVPGPLNHKDPLKKVIPPSVLSFTCFYAQMGNPGSKLDSAFYATGAEEFVLTNPNTAMTCYMVPRTHHVTVLGDETVQSAIYNITHAINDSNRHDPLVQKICLVQDMIGAGARAETRYHGATDISGYQSPRLVAALHEVRHAFDQEYRPVEIPLQNEDQFDVYRHQDTPEREAFIRLIYAAHTKKTTQSETSSLSASSSSTSRK